MSNSATLLGPSISIKTVGYAYRTNKEFTFFISILFEISTVPFLEDFLKTLPSVLYQPFEIGFCHVLLNWPRLDKTNSIITGACCFFYLKLYISYRLLTIFNKSFFYFIVIELYRLTSDLQIISANIG